MSHLGSGCPYPWDQCKCDRPGADQVVRNPDGSIVPESIPVSNRDSRTERRCPVCGNRNDGGGTEPGCNPHNCPSWEVTHIYDRKTMTWVPVARSAADNDASTEADTDGNIGSLTPCPDCDGIVNGVRPSQRAEWCRTCGGAGEIGRPSSP